MWQDGPAYVRVFVHVLRDIFKEDTVEYVLALIDEMLTGNLLNKMAFFLFLFLFVYIVVCYQWRN